MKNNKIQIIGGIIIVVILVIMMLNSLVFSLAPKILNRLHLSNDKINDFFQVTEPARKIDYSKIYPFNEEDRKENKKNITEKYLALINSIKERLERNSSKELYGYEKFIELSYLYNKVISYKIVSNNSDSRIEIADGYYTGLKKQTDTNYISEKIIEFDDFLKSSNINHLYVYAPTKISRTQKFSSIYSDYTNENADNLLNFIKRKVDYIDLRENMNKEGLNQLYLYFKTDHHWLPETGLWATNEISNYINQNYNFNLETQNLNKKNFEYKVYPNFYLGSDGRYVSLANADPEDFTLILPKFTTELHVKIPDKDIDKTDSYENTLIDWDKIKYKNYYKISQYTSYMHGDRPLVEIENKKVLNGKKILLIRDSFAGVVSPFLALENEYLSIIDLRYFNGSLKSYIKSYQPDLVITLYSGFNISDYQDKTSDSHYLIDRLNY